MTLESILGITASLIAIGSLIGSRYKDFKKKPLTSLMNELADKNTSIKRQQRILSIIDKRLLLSKQSISSSYIRSFHSNGRSKSAIFHDICNENNIEPTPEICKLLLGFDDSKFRSDWGTNRLKVQPREDSPEAPSGQQIAYLSALLHDKYPETTKRLTDILNKHNISFKFLEGTKDIWCRDYMPVQTPTGKFIQFRYEPSYLNYPKYANSRSDVRLVNELNGIKATYSDINLDGGNVVMYGTKAIITDRVFSENPEMGRDEIRKQLAELLECEIIIIPSLAKLYDFTGHADGMVRFVDENTVIGNDLSADSRTFQTNMERAMRLANLNYIDFPYFNHEIKGNEDHAIGIYLNYLEVGNLIVMPIFGVPGNKDADALAKLKDVFPNKIIETIDYNDVALTGGILNCTTWVIRK